MTFGICSTQMVVASRYVDLCMRQHEQRNGLLRFCFFVFHCTFTSQCILTQAAYMLSVLLVGRKWPVGKYHSRNWSDSQEEEHLDGTGRHWSWQGRRNAIERVRTHHPIADNSHWREVWKECRKCSLAGREDDESVWFLPGKRVRLVFFFLFGPPFVSGSILHSSRFGSELIQVSCPYFSNSFHGFQFFVKTADTDVGRYLHYFTLLTSDQIKDIMDQHNVRRFPVSRRMRDRPWILYVADNNHYFSWLA